MNKNWGNLVPRSFTPKKLKFRENKFSSQGHTAINGQSWVWNSSLQVFLLVWFRAHMGEGSSSQRQRTQVVSQLAVLVQEAGKLWMPPNRNHRPPQGPREGGWGLMATSCLVPGWPSPPAGVAGKSATLHVMTTPCRLVLVCKDHADGTFALCK